MDAFISRKRSHDAGPAVTPTLTKSDSDPTEVKLALLASLHPHEEPDNLLEALLACEGSVEEAAQQLAVKDVATPAPKKIRGAVGYQSSLANFTTTTDGTDTIRKSPTKRGRTLHLYSPEDIARSTPCSIIHGFLPEEQANALLEELLQESLTFGKDTFKLFDRVVTSHHTGAFYVDDYEAVENQKSYVYNGSYVNDIRKTLPEMRNVGAIVRKAVNEEIQKRIKTHYEGQKKLKYQSPRDWQPNTAFVNCYDGGKESVGYHSDQLTYLGPRAIIGSLSLGVAREFRVRRVVPRNTNFESSDIVAKRANEERANTEGQISIHLPHNSLLVMHAEMQEEWKHSIAPAQAIDPHPLAKNKRLNVTYRWYRESFHHKYTPRCKCGVATALKCVQRKQESRGRYMWMCDAGHSAEREGGCNFFQWAEFDEDGEPPWSEEKRQIPGEGHDPR